jgi:hypothetical protein
MFGLSPPILLRAVILLMAGVCLLLLLFRPAPPAPSRPDAPPTDLTRIAAEVDRDVDSILVDFRIEKNLWRKHAVNVPGATVPRTERKVLATMHLPAVLLTAALDQMAKGFGGRAIGTENTKEGSVSVHIEVGGMILQTIILRK